MARPWRVGVAGLRRGAGLLAVLASDPRVAIAGLADPDAERLAAVAAAHPGAAAVSGFDDLLRVGLDLVVIATPMPQHAAQSIVALDAGVHVLCEVPAVARLDEAPALVAAVRRSRASYMLAENCCYWHFTDVWRDWVNAGRLGEPMYAEAEYVHDVRSLLRDAGGKPTWRASLSPIQYCTHSLGPLLKVIGGRCVTAVGMSSGPRMEPDLGFEDIQVSLLQTDRGVPIKILCAFGVAREPAFHTYTIYGSRGTLERPRGEDETRAYFTGVSPSREMERHPIGIRHPDAPGSASAGGHGTAEWAMARALLDALDEGAPSPLDVFTGLEMTLPGLCALESIRGGGAPIDVPDYR